MGSLLEYVEIVLGRVPQNECSSAFVMTAVGSLSDATLRLANASRKDDTVESGGVVSSSGVRGWENLEPQGKNDIRQWKQRFEIVSLVGTFSRDGGCHLHVSLSDYRGNTIGGHLIDGVVFTTVEVVLGTIRGVGFQRIEDDETGFRELLPVQLPDDGNSVESIMWEWWRSVGSGIFLGMMIVAALSSKRSLAIPR